MLRDDVTVLVVGLDPALGEELAAEEGQNQLGLFAEAEQRRQQLRRVGRQLGQALFLVLAERGVQVIR